MQKEKSKLIPIGILVLIFSLLFILYVFAWDEPSQSPPGCNPGDPGCDEPINVGPNPQVKRGILAVPDLFLSTSSEGNIYRANMIMGHDDLHLRSDTSGTHSSIYLDDNDSAVVFFTANNPRMVVDSLGNVGIGKTPNYLLDVAGDINFTGTLYQDGSPFSSNVIGGGGTATQLAFFTSGTEIGSDSNLWWDNTNKRIGVGTGSPASQFHITDDLQIGTDGVNRSHILTMWSENGYQSNIKLMEANNYGMGIRYVANDNKLYFDRYQNSTSPTVSVTIQRSDGNVGIGTTGPSERLQVVGNIKLGGSEGDIVDADEIIGAGDLFLKSNSSEDGPIEIGGSQLNFYSSGLKWQIDSSGILTTGSVPWGRLTSFPTACGSGEYVTGLGSSLTCSVPAGGIGGGGTATQLAFFTSGTEIGSDSNLWWDNSAKALVLAENLDYNIHKDGDSIAFENNTGSDCFKFGQDGNLVITGCTNSKLTADVIDPHYEIDGNTYATYVSDYAGGLKTETAGKGELDSSLVYIIDFDELETGSDLWLFAKATDFGTDMENLTLLLTPEGNKAELWYELSPSKNQVLIHGDKQTKFSFKFLAPRENWQDYPTFVEPVE
jgi:hypothetical protein